MVIRRLLHSLLETPWILWTGDMFALSDEELPIPTASKWNAVEEHLAKQLVAVQTRIIETISDINDVQDTKRRILKSLQYQAR